MKNVLVEYQFDGDDRAWRKLVSDFLSDIEADTQLVGNFHYQVFSLPEGRRLHIGRWANENALKYLQSKEFFRTFSHGVKALAGDSLKTSFGEESFTTSN